ncbi:hypothetical protein PPYR_13834 [Photinus pyralis]|uniref:Allatostatin CC n=1 Tax=Photinus pyralis TaxID=7054 RepID=A0A5N4AA78_PHOPY|nr:uncharacterized protein LOC116179229 [Photinus pyralis]KAB0794214.1 hypothetical protein PPYR_13834 [Photinus pyralis]
MESKQVAAWFGVCLVCILVAKGIDAFEIVRRSAAPERDSDDYPDYQLGVRYDEYPMIVPKKRAALLLDRLMVALQKAIEEEEEPDNLLVQVPPRSTLRPDDVRSMDLQRRGHQGGLSGQQKGRVYWRCYFNAVTCFK